MPAVKRPGKVGLYVELPEALNEELRAYCERTGSGVAEQVRLAIRRHLTYPPAPEPPPVLPDCGPAAQPAPARRGGRTGREADSTLHRRL